MKDPAQSTAVASPHASASRAHASAGPRRSARSLYLIAGLIILVVIAILVVENGGLASVLAPRNASASGTAASSGASSSNTSQILADNGVFNQSSAANSPAPPSLPSVNSNASNASTNGSVPGIPVPH